MDIKCRLHIHEVMWPLQERCRKLQITFLEGGLQHYVHIYCWQRQYTMQASSFTSVIHTQVHDEF